MVCFAGDRTLRVWDIRGGETCTVHIQAHSEEILSCDWCKYDRVSVIILVTRVPGGLRAQMGYVLTEIPLAGLWLKLRSPFTC